jgi:hypothetical protein
MNPELWLDDYHLAYQLGGADDDRFIIRNLPIDVLERGVSRDGDK